MLDKSRHPCFNANIKGLYGRIHLPVAPKCNIQCNFCNRKYDCANESRPGVTSAVLSPVQAVAYLEKVVAAEPRITVVGIAGPGDPFANAVETMDTLRRIRSRFPEMLLCLASNGLGLPPYVDEIAALDVSHVTVTVNAVDPAIGAKIYGWVRDGKIVYRGEKGASLLLSRQLESIKLLKAAGVTVKVNTIIIPGANDEHAVEVAKTVAALGADMLNCIPLHPNSDTVFAAVPEPSKTAMKAIQAECETYLPQMRHCTRCRADAVGLLGEDRSAEFRGCLSDASRAEIVPRSGSRPYVAVATMEGMLVNLHLGEAAKFQIWSQDSTGGYKLVEERSAPPIGGGPKRWLNLAESLMDCRAVLVSAFGETPGELLKECGILPVQMQGFISEGLDAVFGLRDLGSLKGRTKGLGCCKGGGLGGGCG